MTHKLITIGAALGTAFLLAVSSAWGASAPGRDSGHASGARLGLSTPAQNVRDAGDATAARLVLQSRKAPPITVVRDAGDATAAKNGLRGGSERNQSRVPVVRDAGDATAARLALKSGSMIR